jgi:superfamily II DNA or RNA helicase
MGVEPGVVRGGQEPDWKPITIASVFKLVRMLDDEATLGELAKFGFVIVDEAHHQPAATFKKVLGCIPAYYRLGLTATPEREDGRTKLIDWSFGDVICQRTVPELVRAGWLILPQGYAVHTGWKYEYKGGRPDVKSEATARALVASKSRNALIAKCAHREYNNGCVVLVMTSRLAHVPKLRAALEDRGVDSIGLNGKSTRKKRTDTIKAMRKGEPMVVVSLPIFDEGVDVPSLGAIMLAFPEKAKGKLIQRSGRLMRPFRGRTPTLYDFLDDDVELCANRWEARKRVLTRYLGIELTELSHDEI